MDTLRNAGRPKRSLGRRVYIFATWVALVYSVYALPGLFDWRALLRADGDWQRATPLRPSGRPQEVEQPPPGKPQEVELAGLWVPDEETHAHLSQLNLKLLGGPAAPHLSLTKHTFEVRDVPYLVQEKAPRILSASWRGSWNLYRQQDMWAIYLPGGPADTRGFLHGEGPPYRLMLTVGDRSLNRPLWFVKK